VTTLAFDVQIAKLKLILPVFTTEGDETRYRWRLEYDMT